MSGTIFKDRINGFYFINLSNYRGKWIVTDISWIQILKWQ